MTQVTFFERNGRYVGFEAEGHSGFAESGEDIVCAAVSAITLTALNGIESVAGARTDVNRNDDTGYLRVNLSGDDEDYVLRDAHIILRTACEGIRLISGDYPEYVGILIDRRR